MKIDMQLIRDLVAANAPASAVLAYLERVEKISAPRRQRKTAQRQAQRKRHASATIATHGDNVATSGDMVETPRAKLFREGKAALLTLNISKARAGGLITEWLSLTKENEVLILDTIKLAQKLAVSDAPSWILSQLRGKNGPNRRQSVSELAFDLADEARELERQAGISR